MSPLKFIAVVRPKDSDDLQQQIIAFVGEQLPVQERVSIVGLIRGIAAFAGDFHHEKQPTIIKANQSVLVVVHVDEAHFIVGSIAGDSHASSHVSILLARMLLDSYDQYTLLNSPLGSSERDTEACNIFYSGLLSAYNAQQVSVPVLGATIPWTNKVNYRGFLSTLPGYKKSTLDPTPFKALEVSGASDVVVCSFSPQAKKHGIVYTRGDHEKSHKVLFDFLDRVFYNGKMDMIEGIGSDNLYEGKDTQETARGKNNTFSTEIENSVETENSAETGAETGVQTDTTSNRGYVPGFPSFSLPEMLPSINTVVSPIHYTVSNVAQPINNTVTTVVGGVSKMLPTPWWSQISEAETTDEEDDQGVFIQRGKKVYVEEHGEFVPMNLVLYKKGDLLVALFYDKMLDEFDALESQLSSIGDNMTGSVLSVASLTVKPDLDTEFFYIIYDQEEGYYESSLPYLPNVSLETIDYSKMDKADRTSAKFQNAMVFLHGQSLEVFLQNPDFFYKEGMTEFFHKFSSKANNWMFYFIRHGRKRIVVMKNSKSSIGKVEAPASAPGGFLDNLSEDVREWVWSVTRR